MSGREITELVMEIQRGYDRGYGELLSNLEHRVRAKVVNELRGFPPIEVEEIVENCLSLGIMKSVRMFNPDRSGSFLTFFYRVMRTYIYNKKKLLNMEKNRGIFSTVSFNNIPPENCGARNEEENEEKDIDIQDSPNGNTEYEYTYMRNGIMETLSPKAKEVFFWLDRGYKQSEIRKIYPKRDGRNEVAKSLREIRRNRRVREFLANCLD